MNEKKYRVFLICVCIVGFVIGFAGAKFTVEGLYGGRSPGDVDQLIVRYNQLDREYSERQQIIENQQRIIRSGIDECIGYVEIAGAIIERTSENTNRAISNLNEAIILIKQGIAEREALKNELNNIRSGLYWIGDANREFDF